MARNQLAKIRIAVSVILLSSVITMGAQSPDKQPTQGKKPAAANKVHEENQGQRVFDQNCSRCHNTPDGFSPHVSGTVARHMRVRAQLSEHDYQELLRFLNP
jgi:cytochrome c5